MKNISYENRKTLLLRIQNQSWSILKFNIDVFKSEQVKGS